MRRTANWVALAAITLVLAACRTGLPTSDLVELYDEGAEAGMIELEMERDGSITEAEVDIDVADLPPAVVAAARARLPGGEITGAEREIQLDGSAWEVKMRADGRDWEFVIDADGTINEVERELAENEAPAAVLAAAKRAVPDSTFKSVEVIEHADGREEYHVKRLRNGVSYKTVLAPDGTVLRRVREHRAEIEIPLSD